MKSLCTVAALAFLATSQVGCATRDTYNVGWLYSENIQKKLDAGWFLREVMDGKGTAAVELMYCPILPEQPVVCRTSVVWQRDARALVDHPRLGPAPAPLTP